MKKTKDIKKNDNRPKYAIIVAAVALFATVGVLLLMRSDAAVFVASSEAEAGAAPAGSALKVAGNGASGGQVVKFGSSTTPPPPPTGGGGLTDPTCSTSAPSAQPGYTLVKCEDFNGSGIPAGWGAYTGGGGSTTVGVGRRPSQCVVSGGILVQTQNSDGATCGMSSNFNGKFGYWEVKMRTYSTGGGGSAPHPVLILWPDAEDWGSGGGELDYFESNLGENAIGVYLHCASPGQVSNRNCFTFSKPLDIQNWHVYGFKWTSTTMTGYVDGVQIYSTGGNGSLPPRSMHQTIQLDNLTGRTPVSPGKMEVDWARQYRQ